MCRSLERVNVEAQGFDALLTKLVRLKPADAP
jgi:hypothetical protein